MDIKRDQIVIFHNFVSCILKSTEIYGIGGMGAVIWVLLLDIFLTMCSEKNNKINRC